MRRPGARSGNDRDSATATHAAMTAKELEKYFALDADGERLLAKAFDKMGLTARGATRILKVARTIADLAGSESVLPAHVAEAIRYRGIERKYI